MKRVLVGISGGVDSAVTTYLLKKEGFEVVGIYLKMHKDVPHEENLAKIETLSKTIGFEYVVEDISEAFEKRVYDYFIKSYQEGETPNPCAMCNREIKFGEFMPFREKYKCDFIATGHYIKSDTEAIYKATDEIKDQSYFLFGIDKSVLKYTLFPLGAFMKEEVKALASKVGLDIFASQKESQDICFIDTNYIDVLQKHFSTQLKGKVVNTKREVIGNHKGYMHYTIGQRKGFTLFKSHVPHYVVGVDSKKNQIIVGDQSKLQKRVIFLKQCNLFIEKKEFTCEVKVRYRSKAVGARVVMDGSKATVYLDEEVGGIAKGQACVFYEGNKLLGGGWIRSAKARL